MGVKFWLEKKVGEIVNILLYLEQFFIVLIYQLLDEGDFCDFVYCLVEMILYCGLKFCGMFCLLSLLFNFDIYGLFVVSLKFYFWLVKQVNFILLQIKKVGVYW